MSNNSNAFRLGNEQLLLINILNSMYNDNLRQITNLNEILNNLNNSNNQIRDTLIQILNNPNVNQSNNSRRSAFSDRRTRENNDRINNSNRPSLNRPYIIDSITQYTFPTRRTVQSVDGPNRVGEINRLGTERLLNGLLNTFMQPVEVYPTQSQIEAATRRVQYCNISRPLNTQCPISLDDFTDSDIVTVIRPCGHIFQTEHLMNWFRTNCRCPVCRYDIRDYNSNASTEYFSNRTQPNPESTQRHSQRTDFFDSSNNNIERNTINRIDSINSVSSNASDIVSAAFNDNIFGTTDLSGNTLDNILGDTSALFYVLNSMNNRDRNFR
jgi:hypothetical protein